MKFTDIKKKLLVSSLAFAMVVTSISVNGIYGENDTESFKVTLKKEVRTKANIKKAILSKNGTVTERTDADVSNGTNILHLSSITDLMIDTDVVSISAGRFKDLTGLTSLSFKEGATSKSKLTTIGKNAFKNTGITSVTFPKALTTIDSGAFADNKALTEVSFTNSKNLEFIKTGAFENSALTTIDLSPMSSGTAAELKIEDRAFKGNKKLTSAKLPTNMTELTAETFASTGITTFEIIKEITTVSPLTFYGTPLQTLTVHTDNARLSAEDNVLYNKNKTKLALYPEGKAETEFTMKDTITHIENGAFSSALRLTKLTTGAGLTTIGEYAFAGATKLSEVVLNSNNLVQIGRYAFKETAISSIALIGTIQGIEAYAFAGASKLANLDLRKATAIKTVKANAFKDTALHSMFLSNDTGPLNAISEGAFTSNATTKQISFIDATGAALTGATLVALKTKYATLTESNNGSWTFNIKLPTPKASANYTTMKLTGLEASASYMIDNVQYTADAKGELALSKVWGGKTIKIIRNAIAGQTASDAQSLVIKGIYSVMVDGTEVSVKEVGASVEVTAPVKPGYVFTTWTSPDVTLTTATNKAITFTMPSKDVRLTRTYSEIVVETLAKDLLYDGKSDIAITIKSARSNFSKLAVKNTDLTATTDYTASGSDTTILTLKSSYLTKQTTTTEFTATFTEGGDIKFSIRLLGAKPVAIADYGEMKLTGLVANADYKINNVVKTADAHGKIDIAKTWGNKKLDIIKVATETERESQTQELKLDAFYTIQVNGQEVSFATVGTKITLKAERKAGFKLTEWSATGITLTAENAKKEEIEFTMPAKDVQLKTSYTKIITTQPEDMLYDGTKEVAVRFDIPMNEFKYIEHAGKLLIVNEDYTLTNGSTIVTFTKAFLDKTKGDINGINAVFTNATVDFAIRLAAPVPPVVNPNPPVVNPNPPVVDPVPPVVPLPPVVNPAPPVAKPTPPATSVAPNKATVVSKVIKKTGTPKTGDTTNILFLLIIMLVCAGSIILVKKKIKHS